MTVTFDLGYSTFLYLTMRTTTIYFMSAQLSQAHDIYVGSRH